MIECHTAAPLAGCSPVGRADRIEGSLGRLRDEMHRPAGWMHRAHPERLAVDAAVPVGMGGVWGKWTIEGTPGPKRMRPGSMPHVLAP